MWGQRHKGQLCGNARGSREYVRSIVPSAGGREGVLGWFTVIGGGEGDRGDRRDSRQASALQLAADCSRASSEDTICMLVDKESSRREIRSDIFVSEKAISYFL